MPSNKEIFAPAAAIDEEAGLAKRKGFYKMLLDGKRMLQPKRAPTAPQPDPALEALKQQASQPNPENDWWAAVQKAYITAPATGEIRTPAPNLLPLQPEDVGMTREENMEYYGLPVNWLDTYIQQHPEHLQYVSPAMKSSLDLWASRRGADQGEQEAMAKKKFREANTTDAQGRVRLK